MIGHRKWLWAALAALFVTRASADTLFYDNTTAATGTQVSWTISGTFEVGDSFTITSPMTVTGAVFWVWEPTNTGGPLPDALQSVQWAIVNNDGSYNPAVFPFQNGLEAQGTGFTGTLTPCAVCGVINPGTGAFNIFEEYVGFGNVVLQPGTYWLLMSGAVATGGISVSWDQSSGPSSAYDIVTFPSTPTSIPSESFQLYGNAASTAPEPGTLALLGGGLLVIGGARRRKKI